MDEMRPYLDDAASAVEPRADLWSRIVRRRRARQRVARIAAIAVAVLAVACGGTVVAVAFRPEGSRPPVALPRLTPVSVTIRARGTSLTCVATISSAVTAPGQPLRIRYLVRNDSSVRLGYYTFDAFGGDFGRVVLRDASAHVLFDTSIRHAGQEGPAPSESQLAPGQTARVSSESVVVRWGGILRVQGRCPALSRPNGHSIPWSRAPSFVVRVAGLGPAPSPTIAMSRAVAGTHGLFEHCRPGPDGQAIVGVIFPPHVEGDSAWRVHPRSFPARCWADVVRGSDASGFVRITLYFATPPNVPVTHRGAFGDLTVFPGGRARPAEVGQWEVVVTSSAVVTTELPRADGRSGPGGEFDYDVTGARWEASGMGCGDGEFYGPAAAFFAPAGRNACKAHA